MSANQTLDVFSRIETILKNSKRILVISHIDPDGDALGTQLAFAAYLRSMDKEVFLVRYSHIPLKYQTLPDVNQIKHFEEYSDNFKVDTALVLECPNLDRAGDIIKYLTDDVTLINLDHHLENDNFGAVNWINRRASSVGEMTFEYFNAVGYKIDRHTAEQLYVAIMTDTGRFRYMSTTSDTMRVVADLIEAGADPQKLCDQVYFNMSTTSIMLLGKVLNEIEFRSHGRICLLGMTQQMLEETGADAADSDGIVDFTLITHGAEAGVLVKEVDENNTKLSLRSRDGINVSAIAAQFGGGGHFNASGCTLSLPYAEARKKAIELLEKAVNDTPR